MAGMYPNLLIRAQCRDECPRQNPRDILTTIARQAMLDQGLLPDFSPPAQAQANALTRSAADTGARDLRAADWVSVDNDDSRDLDQLSVAESLDDGSTRLLVAMLMWMRR